MYETSIVSPFVMFTRNVLLRHVCLPTRCISWTPVGRIVAAPTLQTSRGVSVSYSPSCSRRITRRQRFPDCPWRSRPRSSRRSTTGHLFGLNCETTGNCCAVSFPAMDQTRTPYVLAEVCTSVTVWLWKAAAPDHQRCRLQISIFQF